MENLKVLSLAHTSTRELPPSFRNLTGLERLELGSNLCHLPSSIYQLQHLRKLLLYGNDQFATGLGSEDLNLLESIVKFNRLQFLLIKDSKFLQEIPKLPKSIREVRASNCISLNSKSSRKLFLQFGRKLGLPLSMKCLGLKDSVLMDSNSHRKLLHQIDYSSQQSLLIPFTTVHDFMIDYGVYITVPGKKIPKWFNYQSIESYIPFWVRPEFPTIAVCVAFHLFPLKDNFANNNDKYSFVRDDIISWVCDVNIFTNSHKQPFIFKMKFYHLKCDHLWFYCEPHSQLQQYFRDMMQGDRNHVKVSCKISCWKSRNGKFAPVIARMGVHAECICRPQNSVIIDDNFENVDDNSDDAKLAPLLPPFSSSSRTIFSAFKQ